MIGFIIWVIGVILTIKACLEILKWNNVDGLKKLIVAVLLLITNWIGLAVYYLWGRNNLPNMLKS